MRRKNYLAAVLGLVICLVSVVPLFAASEVFLNDSGGMARAIRITFSEPVEITGFGDTFDYQSPKGKATTFVFTGTPLDEWWTFWVSWSPDSANVMKKEWLGIPHISLSYNHLFFVQNNNSASQSWETKETVAWARWGFWISSTTETAFPLKMQVTPNLPINMSIWHKPPIVEIEPLVYQMSIPHSDTDAVFMMGVKPTVDPGMSLRCIVRPQRIPPGISDVQVQVEVTVKRPPTINGEYINVRKAWIQIFGKSYSDVWPLQFLDVTVYPLSAEVMLKPAGQNLAGCRLDLTSWEIPKIYDFNLVFHIKNSASRAVAFKPVIGVNLEAADPMLSQDSATIGPSPTVSWQISGPNGETIDVSCSTNDEQMEAIWNYKLWHDGTICAYWPQVTQVLSNEQ